MQDQGSNERENRTLAAVPIECRNTPRVPTSGTSSRCCDGTAAGGPPVVHQVAADPDFAIGDRLYPRDHARHGLLAAARGARGIRNFWPAILRSIHSTARTSQSSVLTTLRTKPA